MAIRGSANALGSLPGGGVKGIWPALFAVAALLGSSGSARALVIDATYDPSVGSAPAGFTAAFQDAVNFYQSTFSDPITINIDVGWGEVAGSAISSGALGESETYLAGFYNYGQVRNALTADRSSAADLTAVASLPASDPTAGRPELMATAEAKALGLRGGAGTDGFVGFDKTSRWTFNPAQRAVGGAYDFIGVAEHEISEVMGRMADLGTFDGALTPLDLFRYSASGRRALAPGNGQYLSINGGAANLDTFNGTNGGDLGDWAGRSIDAYNAFAYSGVALPVSAADITEMDILGYNLTGAGAGGRGAVAQRGVGTAAPHAIVPIAEPSSMAVLAAAVLGLALYRRKRAPVPTRS